TAINPDLDAATRSVRLQATFANAEQLLRPGMFVRVEVIFPEEQTVLAVPATAILSAPYGDSVYVIESHPAKNGGKPEALVSQKFVRTGRSRGDFISILSSLQPSERGVSGGVFTHRNGVSAPEK